MRLPLQNVLFNLPSEIRVALYYQGGPYRATSWKLTQGLKKVKWQDGNEVNPLVGIVDGGIEPMSPVSPTVLPIK